MKKYLVTGATGFLGTHLVERLRAQQQREGFGIRLLCRGPHRWANDPGMEVVRGDVLSRSEVDRAVAGVAGIFHLAGQVGRDPRLAPALFDLHIQGTRNICEAALAHGRPKILLASSSGTVAASRQPVLFTEAAPYTVDLCGHWSYYLSKIYQEKLALDYARRHNLPVVLLNPSLLLGPGDARLSSTGDIQTFLDGYFLNVPSGGLNFVDVRDTADVFLRAMTAGVPGQRYLIGGHNVTIKEFFALLERASGVRTPRLEMPESFSRGGAALLRGLYRLVGRTYPVADTSIEMAYRFWYIDNTRARTELELVLRPAEETIRDTVAYLREQKARARRN